MRPLSKSRFKLALECPTKLYYTKKPEYETKQEGDSFIEALAQGGYQVGELAKCYYPGGHDITENGHKTPLERTNKLLKQENVIIYEAAIQFGNFFIRVDILEKKGNSVNLIEVKSKSVNSQDPNIFLNKKGYVKSDWSANLQDVAFQKYVMHKAFPEWNITTYLMLADKTLKSTINGLNQKFQLIKDDNGRTTVHKVGSTVLDDLGEPVLTAINVNGIADRIINDEAFFKKTELTFESKINKWAEHYEKDTKIISQVGLHCFKCEFNANESDKKSGFKECWSHFYNWTEEQYKKPRITEIWNFKKNKKLFEKDILFLDQLSPEDIGEINPDNDGTLSKEERQWMQIEKVQQNDDSFYFDKEGMKDLISGFKYPLHFIDFETSMVAIPFYKGQHPYEQIAFQFSHHILREDGSIEHAGEFIEKEKGKFPNFNFIRALKKELETDNGTIFRYAAHENSVLNQVCVQLNNVAVDDEVPDKEELVAFIHSITHSKDENRVGERNMVDLLEMVRDYFYDPRMGGSNSIKKVLPAVLSRSKYIQEKYSKPVYGKNSPIKSLNFDDGWIWIRKDEAGKIISPYKLLPQLFENIDQNDTEKFITKGTIADGGAALTAFARMQFTQISDLEREQIIQGLLKYCELDTLAMVMIYEFWHFEITR